MKAWWPAEGNGTDVVNGFGVSLYGGAGYAPGKIGRAFSFDGTGYARTTFWWHEAASWHDPEPSTNWPRHAPR